MTDCTKYTRNSAVADKPRNAAVQYAMAWLTHTHLPTFLTTQIFGRSRSNVVDTRICLNLCALEPRPLGTGMWLTTRNKAHTSVTIFGHGYHKIFAPLESRSLGRRSWLTHLETHQDRHVLHCRIWSFHVKWYESRNGNQTGKLSPSCSTFQVTQGHRNWHGPIGYIWVLLVIMALSCTASRIYRDIGRTFSILPTPCVFTNTADGFP